MSAKGEEREGGSEQRSASLQKLEVPPHIKHDAGSLSSGSLSETESYSDGYRSVPSGLELSELDVEGCVQEVMCAPLTWQELIVEDLHLIPEELADQEARASQDRKDVCKEKEAHQSTKRKSAKLWRKFSWYVILFLIAGSAFIFIARGHLLQMLNWLEHLPWLESIIVFVVLFTVVCLPFGFGYIILNVMAGYLYGLVRGQVVVMVAVAVGVSVSFLLCRSWFRDYAKDMITSSALRAVMRVVEGPNGIKVIMLTRLTPIPVGLQNALFAMTNVKYSIFLLGSLIGFIPTQLLNTYMGSTVRNMQEVLADKADGYIILCGQAVFTIVLMLYVVKAARRELAKLTHSDVETGNADTGFR